MYIISYICIYDICNIYIYTHIYIPLEHVEVSPTEAMTSVLRAIPQRSRAAPRSLGMCWA